MQYGVHPGIKPRRSALARDEAFPVMPDRAQARSYDSCRVRRGGVRPDTTDVPAWIRFHVFNAIRCARRHRRPRRSALARDEAFPVTLHRARKRAPTKGRVGCCEVTMSVASSTNSSKPRTSKTVRARCSNDSRFPIPDSRFQIPNPQSPISNFQPQGTTAASRVTRLNASPLISATECVPVRIIATRISRSIRVSRFSTPAWPPAASA